MFSPEVDAWITLILRWAHIFAVILWIGQTYMFNRMERNLKREEGSDSNAQGHVWMVHGGGLFLVQKHPFRGKMPGHLLWFKWEAAVTWITGAALITILYYLGGYLVESYPEQNHNLAVAVGIGSIVLGWGVYELLALSPLAKNDIVFGAIAFCLIVGLAYLLPSFHSTRSSYIHVGAVLGTIMVANVWFRILPAMRRIIALRSKGEEPSEALLAMGPRRSKHNTYIVAPLLLIMISNHYPVISYGHKYSYAVIGIWLILGWGFAKLMKG